MSIIWLSAIACLASCLLTQVLRRYALWRSIMDIPNARSSHTVPTPRGGGVAIVVVYLLALAWLWHAGYLVPVEYFALAGSGLLVAVIGFLDDHRHIPARWRLLGHFAAATWALYWLGGLSPQVVGGVTVSTPWLLLPFATIYLVWLLNLYNFMDGIDGIASLEAIVVCLAICLVYIVGGHPQAAIAPLLLAAAAAGFLIWNFPPAKIFMGDAGSGFLGISLGVLSLQGAGLSSSFLWAWIILLGVFIVDASFTLLRRLYRGERVYQAHRRHAYQHAARHVGSHLPVTVASAALTACWLAPIALCVTFFGFDGLLSTCVAYCPLVILGIKYKAGQPEA